MATDDALKGISMFRDERINVPILGIVENMSWFTLLNCHKIAITYSVEREATC